MNDNHPHLEKLKHRMREWKEAIDRLEEWNDQQGVDTRPEYKQKLETLQKRYQSAEKRLEELKETSPDSDDFRRVYDEVWEDINRSLDAEGFKFEGPAD